MNSGNSAAPRIAVIMPVYNREATVRRAIESLLNQTFFDFELLIIDDGSTDGTASMIAGLDDRRIRYLKQPRNLGVSAARNRGINEARSSLVSFIDSDDYFLPNKLDCIVAYFDRNPEIDVLIDSFSVRYPPEKRRADAPRVNPILESSAEIEKAVFARKIFKATPAISSRRRALIEAGLFDETLKRREDMDLILRLARRVRCATTSEILWTKYWSRNSLSAKQNTFMLAMIEICKRHPQYLLCPEFKIDLARDMARHFLRLIGEGQFSTMVADARRFAEFNGKMSLVKLVTQGVGENLRRSIRKGMI